LPMKEKSVVGKLTIHRPHRRGKFETKRRRKS
jgi:hypothetical protein